MNGLTALVLFGLLFLALNGALSALLQRGALPLYHTRLVRLGPPRRAAWLTALLVLPPVLALAALLPLVVGGALGWMPISEWCSRFHTHCDLLLGSGSATEVLVYGLAGASLALAIALVFLRLGLPLVWAMRRSGAGLSPAQQAVLDAARARFAASGDAPPRVVAIPGLGGGAAVFGLRRPTVLLSLTLLSALRADELYAVLRHECAHFERRDGLWSVAIGLGRSFSPWPAAGRALAALWHQDREILCDDRAVRAGADPLSLAQALVTAARLVHGRTPWWAPALVDGPGAALSARVRRLVEGSPPADPSDAPAVLATCVALVLLAVAGSTFAGEALLLLHCLVEEGIHRLA